MTIHRAMYVLTLGLAVIAASTADGQQRYAFAGLIWGASPAIVQKTLKAEGFVVLSSEDNVWGFEGKALNEIAWVFTRFSNGKLDQVTVTFGLVPEREASRMFGELVASLERVYGTPASRDADETCWFSQDVRPTDLVSTSGMVETPRL